uniref:Putative secreted protein n=1 Tax=Ixodes ricinus TaxID=34613 RepID=A0A6B0UWN2_IXORI
MLSVTARAAAASWFLALGAPGSAATDLAATSSLLDTMDTFLRLTTIWARASASRAWPAISRPQPSRVLKAPPKRRTDEASWAALPLDDCTTWPVASCSPAAASVSPACSSPYGRPLDGNSRAFRACELSVMERMVSSTSFWPGRQLTQELRAADTDLAT